MSETIQSLLFAMLTTEVHGLLNFSVFTLLKLVVFAKCILSGAVVTEGLNQN
jgi:hypothetical protein